VHLGRYLTDQGLVRPSTTASLLIFMIELVSFYTAFFYIVERNNSWGKTELISGVQVAKCHMALMSGRVQQCPIWFWSPGRVSVRC